MDLIIFGLLAWFSGDAVGGLLGAAGSAAQSRTASKVVKAQAEYARLMASKASHTTEAIE